MMLEARKRLLAATHPPLGVIQIGRPKQSILTTCCFVGSRSRESFT